MTGSVTIPLAEYRYLAQIHVLAGTMADELEACREFWEMWDEADHDRVRALLDRYDATATALGRHLMMRANRGG